MRVITGDECGVIKECLPEQGEKNGVQRINANQTMARKHGCVDLCWVRSEQDESFAAISMDNVCSIWERSRQEDSGRGFGRYRKQSEVNNLFDATPSAAIHPSTRPLGLFAVEDDHLLAAAAALAFFALAGEKAESLAAGPGTFVPHFLDALANLTDQEIAEGVNLS